MSRTVGKLSGKGEEYLAEGLVDKVMVVSVPTKSTVK